MSMNLTRKKDYQENFQRVIFMIMVNKLMNSDLTRYYKIKVDKHKEIRIRKYQLINHKIIF